MASITIKISPWNTYTIRVPIADLGSGRTLKCKLCEDLDGDPAPITSALDVMLVEGPTGDEAFYVGKFDTTNLLSAFVARISDVVAAHVYDSAGYHTSEWVLIIGSRQRA